MSTFRSEGLRTAVRQLPCQMCGCAPPSVAAHGNQDKGIGIKASDATLFAACDACHRYIDQGGRLPKYERRALERELNLKTLRALVERGLLIPNPPNGGL